MSMNIALSEHAERIVRAKIADYGSAEAVIETAVHMLHDSNVWSDPEYLNYVRMAMEEAEADVAQPIKIGREAFIQSFHRLWADMRKG